MSDSMLGYIMLRIILISTIVGFISMVWYSEMYIMPEITRQQAEQERLLVEELNISCKIQSFYELNFKQCHNIGVNPY